MEEGRFSVEKTNNTNHKKVFIAVIILFLVASAALTTYYFLVPRGLEGGKLIHIEVTADGSTFKKDIRTDAAYLRGALEEANLIEGQESTYGLWVTAVNGRVANDADMEWWALYVNGEFAMFGVDDMPIEDGDTFTYVLTVGYD